MLPSTENESVVLQDSDAAGSSMLTAPRKTRRRRIILLVVAIVAVMFLFAGGWFAATSFESPAQKAAKAEAPPAGAVTATVTEGNLEETVSATASIARATQQSITVNSSLASDVVTKTIVPTGGQITAGNAVLEINGRPLLALPGAFPFYRDLTVGDRGPDVKQLQSGLDAAGYSVSADGTFGSATTRAVRAMYARAGYTVPSIAASASSSGTDAQGTNTASDSTSTDAGSSSSVGGSSSSGDAATTTSSANPTSAADTSPASQVSVPAAELMIASALPANLITAPKAGSVLTATSDVAVEAGPVIATAPIASGATATIKVGMTGVLTGPDGTGKPVTVTAVVPATSSNSSDSGSDAATSGDSGDDSGVTLNGQSATSSGSSTDGGSAVQLKPTSGAFPTSWLHGSGIAVITVDVAAKNSLIVPSIAVVSGGKDTAHVLKRDSDGTYVSIPVKEAGALDGKSAVRPSSAVALKAGDLVKVG